MGMFIDFVHRCVSTKVGRYEYIHKNMMVLLHTYVCTLVGTLVPYHPAIHAIHTID